MINLKQNNILISIKPCYVQKIFDKSKIFEFRKRFQEDFRGILYIYETSPTKLIVGEAKVKNIIKDSPENLWNKTYGYAGVEKELLLSYYSNVNVGFALEIYDVIKYEKPVPLQDIGLNRPPQSYQKI